MRTSAQLRSCAIVLFLVILLAACGTEPAVQIQPTPMPQPTLPPVVPTAAPVGELTPLDPASCSALADSMGQLINVSVVITQAPMEAYTEGKSGVACRLLATGTGADFENYWVVADTLGAMLKGQGWVEDMQYAAGGPTGMAAGYRQGTAMCLLSSGWWPSKDANCPQDKPISECPLTPEQQLYTITIDCAQGLTPAAPAWAPLDSQSCTAMADILTSAYVGSVVVTTPDAFFVDPIGGAQGTGCKATISGNESVFASPQAVEEKVTGALQATGWGPDTMYAAGSAVGIGQGYRKESGLCLLAATWQPSPDANCPSDKPISECPLTPEQKLYTVELNCARSSSDSQ